MSNEDGAAEVHELDREVRYDHQAPIRSNRDLFKHLHPGVFPSDNTWEVYPWFSKYEQYIELVYGDGQERKLRHLSHMMGNDVNSLPEEGETYEDVKKYLIRHVGPQKEEMLDEVRSTKQKAGEKPLDYYKRLFKAFEAAGIEDKKKRINLFKENLLPDIRTELPDFDEDVQIGTIYAAVHEIWEKQKEGKKNTKDLSFVMKKLEQMESSIKGGNAEIKGLVKVAQIQDSSRSRRDSSPMRYNRDHSSGRSRDSSRDRYTQRYSSGARPTSPGGQLPQQYDNYSRQGWGYQQRQGNSSSGYVPTPAYSQSYGQPVSALNSPSQDPFQQTWYGSQQAAPRSRSSIQCFNCQGYGHIQRDCTMSRGGRGRGRGGYRGNRGRHSGGHGGQRGQHENPQYEQFLFKMFTQMVGNGDQTQEN